MQRSIPKEAKICKTRPMAAQTRVVAALIEQEGKLLIAQRGGNDSFAGKWEFPGGKVQEGESDAQALIREIREELAVEVRVGAMEFENEHDYPGFSVHLLFYRCEIAAGTIADSKDHQRLEWVSRHELERFDFLAADLPLLRHFSRYQ